MNDVCVVDKVFSNGLHNLLDQEMAIQTWLLCLSAGIKKQSNLFWEVCVNKHKIISQPNKGVNLV